MKLNREDFLRTLEFVSAGLASREFIQQSTCFVFVGGMIRTFNDEVSCSCESPIEGEGAVPAKPILDLLRKMPEENILINIDEDTVVIKGKRKQATIRFEKDISLPVEEVEIPDEWTDLPDTFLDGIAAVASCASKEESQLVLTCIHIDANKIEACDRFQFAKYDLETGFDEPVLVRADTLKEVSSLGPIQFCDTKSWIHFRNQFGVVYSLRKTLDLYPNLDHIYVEGGESTTLPLGLEEVVDRAKVFSSDKVDDDSVVVDMCDEFIVIEGNGAFGSYKEKVDSNYDGPGARFLVAPDLLTRIGKHSRECFISDDRLSAKIGRLWFVTCTEQEQKNDNGEK